MDKTMKAAVVRAFGEPLVIEEIAVPQPGPGQILVKVAACGVCHTDLHAARATGRSSRSHLSSPATRVSAPSRRWGPASPSSKRATGSVCHGSTRPAAIAPIAWGDGRRCAKASRIPAIRSTAASPTM